MATEPQVPFRLKTETLPKPSPRLQQPELLQRDWQEQYSMNEFDEPTPPLPSRRELRNWWNRGGGDVA